jgi:hypothetical protein
MNPEPYCRPAPTWASAAPSSFVPESREGGRSSKTCPRPAPHEHLSSDIYVCVGNMNTHPSFCGRGRRTSNSNAGISPCTVERQYESLVQGGAPSSRVVSTCDWLRPCSVPILGTLKHLLFGLSQSKKQMFHPWGPETTVDPKTPSSKRGL